MKPANSEQEGEHSPDSSEGNRQWGLDEINSLMAVMLTQDPKTLSRMTDDLVEGRVIPDGLTLAELSQHSMLPLDAAYRLAKRFPGHEVVAQDLCTRPDVTPEILDEFAEYPACSDIVVRHPKTRQKTLERMAESASLALTYRWELFKRLSKTALEKHVTDQDDFVRTIVATRATSQLCSNPFPPIQFPKSAPPLFQTQIRRSPWLSTLP